MREMTEATGCINCYREEILIYLVQRFGSLGFAQRVFTEMQKRLDDCDVLNYVPNPHIYLIGYVLSLGLEFMQADMEEAQRELKTNTLVAAEAICTNTAATFTEACVSQGLLAGGELWQPQPVSTAH